ncbi:MAG: riboflavin synthase [Candidatus Krumholzibacteriota bacterium]|nr:riboflavin synthase [Candidatus Krumholzibacteriota bacterium]
MFTGLVETTGKVLSLSRNSRGAKIVVESDIEHLVRGESIAINGTCQTVALIKDDSFSCDILPETLRVTNLGMLKPGQRVNLERAMRPHDRLGGHIVNGHIDGTGKVRRISRNPGSIEISVPPGISRYLVAKGSVAVDGISLTIGPKPGEKSFKVFVIPHTWENTTLEDLSPGSIVNIEVDILAKYIDKLSGR